MNKIELNRLNRNKRLLGFLMLHSEKFNEDVPIFEKMVSEFNDKMILFERCLMDSNIDTKKLTLEKNNARNMMIETTWFFSNGLYAYFLVKVDEISANEYNISKSFLINQSDSDCLMLCNKVLKKGKELSDDLLSFIDIGYLIKDLETKIGRYKKIVEGNIKALNNKKDSIKLLKELFVECERYINIFESLMYNLKKKHNDLYEEYLKINALNFTEESEI